MFFWIVCLAALTLQAQTRPELNDGESHGDPPYLLEDGWTPLLNGKDLSGWHGDGAAANQWFTTVAIQWERLLGPTRLVDRPTPGRPSLAPAGGSRTRPGQRPVWRARVPG